MLFHRYAAHVSPHFDTALNSFAVVRLHHFFSAGEDPSSMYSTTFRTRMLSLQLLCTNTPTSCSYKPRGLALPFNSLMFVLECWELPDSKTTSLQDTSKSIQPYPGPINSDPNAIFPWDILSFDSHTFPRHPWKALPPQPPALSLMQQYHIVATVPASSALQCKVIPVDSRCTTSSDNILLHRIWRL